MTCFQVLIFNYIWKNIVDFWVERTVIFKLVSTSECIKDLEYNCNYPNSIPYKLRKLVLKKSIPYLGIKKNQNCSGIFFYGSLKVLVGLFILSSSRIFWLFLPLSFSYILQKTLPQINVHRYWLWLHWIYIVLLEEFFLSFPFNFLFIRNFFNWV